MDVSEHNGAAVRNPPAGPAARRSWLALVGLIGLVAAAYGQTARFDLVLDDHFLVIRNPVFRGQVTWRDTVGTPASAYLGPMFGADRMYRPLMAPVAALDRAVWGMRPGAFHLSSVLGHLAAVLLLWRLAWLLTGSRAAAFAAGALLAVHPSAVEAVAFIAARMDVFVGLGMVAVLLLLRGCLNPGGSWRLPGALLAFAFALGSKETAVAIPAIVTWAAWVAPQWLAGDEGAPRRAALTARLVPFWAMLLLYAGLRQAVMGSVAPMPVRLADMPAQALRALEAVATYSEMTTLPRPETGFLLVGKLPPPTGLGDARVLMGLGMVALLGAGLVWLRRRHPPSALALGWYVAALAPTANLLPIHWEQGVYVAERSLYPALVGWCLFVAAGVHGLVRAAERNAPRTRALVTGAAIAATGTLLVVTAVKVGAWRDDVTLWRTALAVRPGSLEVRLNLAGALAQAGALEAAEALVQETGATVPPHPDVAFLAGWVAELRGDDAGALRQYERAIARGSRQWRAFRQAGVLAARLHEWDRAGHWFQVAAGLYPQAAWPQVGLGWYQERRGRAELARAHFDRAARLEPNSPERPWLLGGLYAAEGAPAAAAQAYQAALRLDPSFVPARRDLALIAEREGRIGEAIGHWRRIAEVLPGRHREEALEHLRRLEPAARGALPGEAR